MCERRATGLTHQQIVMEGPLGLLQGTRPQLASLDQSSPHCVPRMGHRCAATLMPSALRKVWGASAWIRSPQQGTALTPGHSTGISIFYVCHAEETIEKFYPRQASHLHSPIRDTCALSLYLKLKRLNFQIILPFTPQILTETLVFYLPLFFQ